MSAHFPDDETVRTALSLATRAPSVHNSQPWRWRVGDRTVHLYADTSRHLEHTDPDLRDLMLSCGACLHHAVVAFGALGWRSRVTRLPNPADPDHLAAIVLSRSAPSEVDIALAAAIPRRRTDRRFYSAWPVSPTDIGLVGARVARMGISMRRVETTAEMNAIVVRAMREHATDREYLTELTQWSGRHASTAGVPARNTLLSDAGRTMSPRVFAGGQLEQPEGTSAESDHGVLIALGTGDDDHLARLRAGEATSQALLTATTVGLASCPLTEPLELADTRTALREELFDDRDYPQMMIRVGWAPVNADPLPATPRRPLDDVLSRLPAVSG